MARQLRVILVVVLLGLLWVLPTSAQSESEQLLSAGLAAYQQRDFRQAIALWEQAGISQKHMYYNIARAYEQLGEWGDARVNDVRAKIVQDTFSRWREDGSLDAALERGWARQGIETLHPVVWLKRTLRDITRPMGWGILGAGLWIGFWITLVLSLRLRVSRWVVAGFASGMFFWGGVIATNELLDRVLGEAISFESTPVYSGPGSDYALLTSWPEGYDLFIVASRDDWVQVWRADGMSGWIERRLMWEVQYIDERYQVF